MTATTTAQSPLAAPAHPRQALAMIEARLGRAPADALEAAVVLEAWGGLRPEAALDLGELVMEVVPEGTTRRLRPPIVKTPQRSNWLAEILGLAGFVSMATWGVPLGQALPSVNVDIAFRVGVPLALALQWLTRRRYFSGERKLGSFGTDGRAFALVFTLSLCLLLVGGETGLLIMGLEVLWFSGYLLAKDDWGLVYGIALVGVTAALYDGWPPQIVLPVVAFVLLATAVWRVQRHDRARRQKTERNMPIGIFEALPSALIGGALGVMMVFSLTHLRPNGWMLAVALLPAGVASLVAADRKSVV